MIVLAQDERDGRFINDAARASHAAGRASFTDLHRYERKDLQHWYEKQTYLSLGMLLLGAAALDVDAAPMEGFDAGILDRELGLRERGYTATVIVALGYGGSDDFNAKLPKSRLTEDVLFTDIRIRRKRARSLPFVVTGAPYGGYTGLMHKFFLAKRNYV